MADEELEEESADVGEGEGDTGEEGKGKKKFALGPTAVAILKQSLNYLIVAIIAFAVSYMMSNKGGEERTVPREQFLAADVGGSDVFARRPSGLDWPMDEMLVNTSDEDSPHLVKAKIVVSHEEKNQIVLTELNARKTEIHAEIRNIIGSKKYNELNTTHKQKILSREIKERIKLIVGVPGIIDVFLKDFTVH